MRRRTFFIWMILLLFAGLYYVTLPYGAQHATYSPAIKECFGGGTDQAWRACIYRARVGTTGETVYYLHGRGQDENIWNDDTYSTGQIQAYWERARVLPPTVVTISFGRFWLLAPKTAAPNSGLLRTFLDEVIPEIEKRTGAPSARIIAGESMGALNALTAAFHSPARFRRVVTLCPPIYDLSPYAGPSEFLDFFRRSGADPRTILGVFFLAKRYALDEREWAEVSPLRQLEKADPRNFPEMYLSSGLYDRYGVYEGAERFIALAEKRNFRFQWRPLFGGHCAMDVTSFAEALSAPRAAPLAPQSPPATRSASRSE